MRGEGECVRDSSDGKRKGKGQEFKFSDRTCADRVNFIVANFSGNIYGISDDDHRTKKESGKS